MPATRTRASILACKRFPLGNHGATQPAGSSQSAPPKSLFADKIAHYTRSLFDEHAALRPRIFENSDSHEQQTVSPRNEPEPRKRVTTGPEGRRTKNETNPTTPQPAQPVTRATAAARRRKNETNPTTAEPAQSASGSTVAAYRRKNETNPRVALDQSQRRNGCNQRKGIQEKEPALRAESLFLSSIDDAGCPCRSRTPRPPSGSTVVV